MDFLKKGTYVHEYVGELIDDDLSERRGHLYDKHGHSYLFNQTEKKAIDASRKGNKVRFCNHVNDPNIEVKRVFVNGEMRIGFYAKRDIPAQAELFIGYGDTFSQKFITEKKGCC